MSWAICPSTNVVRTCCSKRAHTEGGSAARYESGSIVLTTNRRFRDWGKIFDVDNTLATAMIDRLMHHGEAYVIDGESYRTKDKDPDAE
jgi:DNA replication protein DnaC